MKFPAVLAPKLSARLLTFNLEAVEQPVKTC